METKFLYDGHNGNGWKRTVEIHQKSEEKITVRGMHRLWIVNVGLKHYVTYLHFGNF